MSSHVSRAGNLNTLIDAGLITDTEILRAAMKGWSPPLTPEIILGHPILQQIVEDALGGDQAFAHPRRATAVLTGLLIAHD